MFGAVTLFRVQAHACLPLKTQWHQVRSTQNQQDMWEGKYGIDPCTDVHYPWSSEMLSSTRPVRTHESAGLNNLRRVRARAERRVTEFQISSPAQFFEWKDHRFRISTHPCE